MTPSSLFTHPFSFQLIPFLNLYPDVWPHATLQSKIEMYSKYERQKDKRTYSDRHVLFRGPQYLYAAERIKPMRQLEWTDDGLPIYSEFEEGEGAVNDEAVECQE